MTRNQKEAVALLSAGTFLEYFDLMIYVHMAVLLDTLFFPTDDARVASLLSAFAFCSSFVMRPVGALVFGYIGDHIGRKTTLIFTTLMMGLTCAVMANVPTYAEIGYTASVVVLLCRAMQGMSSMGEMKGAEIYLCEVIEEPSDRYCSVALINTIAVLGGFAALAVASLCTNQGYDWRYAFWIGGLIAGVSMLTRTRLREAPEFSDMKRRMATAFEQSEEKYDPSTGPFILDKKHPIWQQKVDFKTSLSYFCITAGWPLCFYFIYIYCGGLLKKLGYTPGQVIHQSLIVSLVDFIAGLTCVYLVRRFHPLKFLYLRVFLFSPFILLCPFILTYYPTPENIFYIQVVGVVIAIGSFPADAIFIIHFPIFKRFTSVCSLFAFARVLVYVVNAFGLIYLTSMFGHFGLWVLMLPACVAFYFGVRYFAFLEYRYSDEGLQEERDYMDTPPHLRPQGGGVEFSLFGRYPL